VENRLLLLKNRCCSMPCCRRCEVRRLCSLEEGASACLPCREVTSLFRNCHVFSRAPGEQTFIVGEISFCAAWASGSRYGARRRRRAVPPVLSVTQFCSLLCGTKLCCMVGKNASVSLWNMLLCLYYILMGNFLEAYQRAPLQGCSFYRGGTWAFF